MCFKEKQHMHAKMSNYHYKKKKFLHHINCAELFYSGDPVKTLRDMAH